MAVDPKGYYAILGVAASASTTEIKRAFRRRAIDLHPDRNRSPHAAAMFVRLKEAYETLSNASRRASYDIWDSVEDEDADGTLLDEDTEPIVCSLCNKVTAQPRYVIFLRVQSYVVGTSRTSTQGIFCSDCAPTEAMRASLTTWVCGWWALPLGPIYTLHALLRNLWGGIKPRDVNARIAAHQAWHFVAVKQHELARAVAAEALKLIPEKTRVAAEVRASILRVLEVTDHEGPPRRLKNPWRVLRPAFLVQAVPLLVVITVTGMALSTPMRWAFAPRPVASSGLTVPTMPTVSAVEPAEEPPPVVRYVRPPIADNGVPWPTLPAYIPGYPRRFTNGHSTLTVDNSQTDADVFVKLFTTGTRERVLARAFFIPAGGQFTVESLQRGRYDLRYRNLRSGKIVRSEPLEFKEIATGDSFKVTAMRVTLYEVVGGTLASQAITEDEFD